MKYIREISYLFICSFLSLVISNIQAGDFDQYQKIVEKISTRVCQRGTEKKFNKLFSKNLFLGFYIPQIESKILFNVLQARKKLIVKKYHWIINQKNKLRKSNMPFLRMKILKFKIEYEKILNVEKRIILSKGSKTFLRKKLLKIRNNFNVKLYLFMKNKLSIYMPFNYPVSYYNLRRTYELLKNNKNQNKNQNKHKIVDMYFVRKIFEDGAPKLNKLGTDKYLRGITNRVLLNLKKGKTSLDSRLDLDDFFYYITKRLQKSKTVQVQRMLKWQNKTKKYIVLIDKILNRDKNKLLSISNFNKSRRELKNFVLQKEAALYLILKKYKYQWRKFFVLENILTHEVGMIKDSSYFKGEIIKVVKNRFLDFKYNTLNNEFAKRLKLPLKTIAKYKMLNTLFKEGEFSFTYFFMPSVIRLICPDMSKRGKLMRRLNIKKIKDSLKSLNSNSIKNNLRYFSRRSILGKYRMDSIWPKYRRMNKIIGNKLNSKKQKKILVSLKKGKIKYRYRIYKKLFLYKRDDDRGYVVLDFNRKMFYKFYNPDIFSFFYAKE